MKKLLILSLIFMIPFSAFAKSVPKFNQDKFYQFYDFRTEEQLIIKEREIEKLEIKIKISNIGITSGLGLGLAGLITSSALLTSADLNYIELNDYKLVNQIAIGSAIIGLTGSLLFWFLNKDSIKGYITKVDEYVVYRRNIERRKN